jgi:Leucine-rich repeat (LRR) protein
LTKRDSELFMLDKFVIKDVLVESVDTHARFLFENMTTRVDFIYTNGFRRSDIAQTISLFNKNTNSQLSLKLLGHSFEPRPPQPSLIRLKTLCYEQCSVLVDQQFVNELAGFDFEELNIRYISKIEVNAFISLTATCHTLYLHSNKIEHVKSGHLNGLSNLHRLYLNECQLALVDPLTFSALNNLTFLNLYCNRIEKLTRGLFTGLASLEELNLKANRICEIEDDTFQPLTNLQFLDLESNRIERVSARTFAGLVRLKQLNLSSNRLSVLERGSFTHMSELEILKLNGNKLTETVDFENLKRLKSVCMDNNLILAAADLSVGIDRQQRTSGCVKKEIL